MSPLPAIPQITLPRVDMPPGAAPLPMPGVQGPVPLDRPGSITPAQPAGDSFAGMLGRLVEDVNQRQMHAGEMVRALQSGENVSLHQAVIAMEEASVSFHLMVEVRNKLLESYQELMRMQI